MPVSSPTRRQRKLFHGGSNILHALARRHTNEGQVSSVQRPVACGPSNGPCECPHGLGVSVRQEKNASKRPEMEGPPRGRPAPRCSPQMNDPRIHVTHPHHTPPSTPANPH